MLILIQINIITYIVQIKNYNIRYLPIIIIIIVGIIISNSVENIPLFFNITLRQSSVFN